MKMENDVWSDSLIQQTRSMLSSLPFTVDGYIALKNRNGSFGRAHLNDLARGKHHLEDRATGQIYCYMSIEALIAHGWVID
jgi:hypothetical protein